MRSKYPPNFDSNSLRGSDTPAGSTLEIGISTGGIRNNAQWLLSNLVIWMLLILTGGGLSIGHSIVYRLNKSAAKQEEDGERPIWRDVHLYSSTFIIAVKKAQHERRDLLADHAAFCSIWNEISSNKPMMLKVFRPAPSNQYSNRYISAISRETLPVDAMTFWELRPLLIEIRTLIVEGDGTGRGKLEHSGYEAEPAELTLDHPSAHLEPKSIETGPESRRRCESSTQGWALFSLRFWRVT